MRMRVPNLIGQGTVLAAAVVAAVLWAGCSGDGPTSPASSPSGVITLDGAGHGGGGGGGGGGGSSGKAQTAQSVMIDIENAGDFIIHELAVFQFDDTCGSGHFSASGGTPLQRFIAKQQAAEDQKCTFWDGGTLQSATYGAVTVTPTGDGSVDAHSCWTLTDLTGDGPILMCPTIKIMGESFLLSKQFSPNGKFSFTLRNTDGTTRIQNLKVELSGDESRTDYPGHTIVDGDGSNNCFLDADYFGNAGLNGSLQANLIDGKVSDVLAADSWTKNDGGCAYTAVGLVDPLCYTLGVGSYTLSVSGTIKGIDGNANLNFTGSRKIFVSNEGCGP